MKFLGLLALLILNSLVLAPKALALQPIIVSYAVQPVSHFNQQLRVAQEQHQPWTEDPSKISNQYAGDKFTLVSTQANKDSILTYQISELSKQHPQMLLIISLKQDAKLWQISSAQLAWKCNDGQHFGTDRCKIAEHDMNATP
ncbi:hypothetical protein [Shewanella morhuae]|uniref:hypothetical protein n=1 Tax=Shewanella morhuae TaxID=365591 RepID=UPI001BBD72E2|nr:hypothetical protein [Shewanella morhuae]GIU08715.1 hypothetical protein TUM4641_23100 [Shewanella morhuae]